MEDYLVPIIFLVVVFVGFGLANNRSGAEIFYSEEKVRRIIRCRLRCMFSRPVFLCTR